jgi:hypothetical protein
MTVGFKSTRRRVVTSARKYGQLGTVYEDPFDSSIQLILFLKGLLHFK